jgi:hypothetical protein
MPVPISTPWFVAPAGLLVATLNNKTPAAKHALTDLFLLILQCNYTVKLERQVA